MDSPRGTKFETDSMAHNCPQNRRNKHKCACKITNLQAAKYQGLTACDCV